MGLQEEIDQDVLTFFDEFDEASRVEKMQILRRILNKYAQLSSSEYKADYLDLYHIIGNAKARFSTKTLPIVLGSDKRKLNQSEQVNICLVESTVSYLKTKRLFKERF